MLEPNSSGTTLNAQQTSELPKLLMNARVVLCSAPSCKSLATSTKNHAAASERGGSSAGGWLYFENQHGTSNCLMRKWQILSKPIYLEADTTTKLVVEPPVSTKIFVIKADGFSNGIGRE